MVPRDRPGDRLRRMVAEATPGPWEHRVWGQDGDVWPDERVSVGTTSRHGQAVVINPRYGERTQDLANARLIELAPELATWAADAADYLSDEKNRQADASSNVCLCWSGKRRKTPVVD